MPLATSRSQIQTPFLKEILLHCFLLGIGAVTGRSIAGFSRNKPRNGASTFPLPLSETESEFLLLGPQTGKVVPIRAHQIYKCQGLNDFKRGSMWSCTRMRD